MWIYLICFTVSCFLFKVAEVAENKIIYKISTIVALIIPCVLAGCRADNIGTDVQVYVKPLFEIASSASSFLQYQNMGWMGSWKNFYVHDFEIGFSLIVYIVAKIFNNINILFFIIEILIILPFYKGLSYVKKEIPIWLCMLIFYLMNYNTGLNIMRQSIAMSLIFYGFKYIIERKFNKFIFVVLIAMTFHNTAIFGMIIYFIYRFIYEERIEKNIKIVIWGRKLIYLKDISKLKRVFLMSILCSLCLIFLPYILSLIKSIGLGKYVAYIDGNIELLINQIIIKVPFILFIIINWTKYSEKYKLAAMYLAMMIIDLIIVQLGSINDQSWRIASYFSMFNCVSYCSICECSEKKLIRISLKSLLIAYLIAYWIYQFVMIGNHQTIPYIAA